MVTRRHRRWIGLAILAGWMLVLAWHVRREYYQSTTLRLAEASASLIPSASFYSIKLGDTPIGYAASRVDTLAAGFLLEDDMRLRILALGADAPVSARTRVRLGKRLELQEFEFTLRSDLGDFAVVGVMNGDSMLELTINSGGGEEQRLTIPRDGPIVLPQVMPMHFALGEEPQPGATYAYEIFDPSVLERQRVSIEVIGRDTLIVPDSAGFDEVKQIWAPARFDTVETWRIRQGFGGIELDSWLDPDGQVVRATSPLGYTIERTAFEIAWNTYRNLGSRGGATAALGASDIIERTAISVGAGLPSGERIARLAVRLGNVDLEGFDLEGDQQQLRGDTLVTAAHQLPERIDYRLPASRSEWGKVLEATPLIQAEDPEIRRAAEEILGGVTEPGQAAERLNRWVYENLDKQITLSVPSARQVLDGRRGDCNEHTVLYVALARAAGLPARTAAGLVYVRDRFYYHAWPEVWLGSWVPVDPTLNQFPADASHLRFVIGGLARQVELVRLVGLLQLDVLSVEEK